MECILLFALISIGTVFSVSMKLLVHVVGTTVTVNCSSGKRKQNLIGCKYVYSSFFLSNDGCCQTLINVNAIRAFILVSFHLLFTRDENICAAHIFLEIKNGIDSPLKNLDSLEQGTGNAIKKQTQYFKDIFPQRNASIQPLNKGSDML